MNVVERFLNYVKFDTQSDELTNLTPSTPGQMIFAQALEKELKKMGLQNISLDENGYPTHIPHDRGGYFDVAPLDATIDRIDHGFWTSEITIGKNHKPMISTFIGTRTGDTRDPSGPTR